MKNKCPLYHACKEIIDCKKDYKECMLFIMEVLEICHNQRGRDIGCDGDVISLTLRGEIRSSQMKVFNKIYKVCEVKGWTQKVIRETYNMKI